MEKKNLSLKDIEIITTLSDSKKTTVKLVSFSNTKQFAVLKQYPDKQSLGCYEQTCTLQSSFFPKIYNVWEENDSAFLLEEYISGVTLQEKLEDEALLSETELTNLVKQLCEALLVLHSAIPPIIHRDVKPENIIITANNSIKLIDFDAAREYKAEKEHDTILMGTKEYASPEQFGFMQTDIRSDIYSFGIVFSELLSHANVSPEYTQKAKKIIDKATMFDPEKRYANTNQLLKELSLLEKKKAGIMPWFILAGIIGLFFVTILFIKGNTPPINEDYALASNTEKNLETILTSDSPEEDIVVQKPKEEETIQQGNNEQNTQNNTTDITSLTDLSKETPTLAEVYNYVEIKDEVDPTAFYLMESNGYLFNGIPTSGIPAGMYSITQECIIGSDYPTCRFLKGYPRDLVFCDDRMEGSEVYQAYLYPYLEESGTNGEKITLSPDDFTQEFGNVCSVSKEFLQTLEPGAYTLYLDNNRILFCYYLIVHGAEEEVDKFYPRPLNEINYYSSNKQNDVVFYSTGTPYPIKEVRMYNSMLDPENYTLVDGGFGIVFKPDFLEQWKDLEAIELIYVTENDREGGIRIINISNFQ